MVADIVRDVLDFWFFPEDHPRHGQFRRRWFAVDPDFDADVKKRFLGVWEAAAAGGLAHIAGSPRGSLALVIVLDQIPRNMFRGTAKAFSTDAEALAEATSAIALGLDCNLPQIQRIFLYLPFEHSERLADQDRCVTLMKELGHEMAIDYAVRHRDIVARFGRFPHRNAILNRQSTPEEEAFLRQPNSAF